jgi:hypothetical protein
MDGFHILSFCFSSVFLGMNAVLPLCHNGNGGDPRFIFLNSEEAT